MAVSVMIVTTACNDVLDTDNLNGKSLETFYESPTDIDEAISGVYSGMKNEILGAINSYKAQYESLKIVVTGGDINLFDLEPKNRIFADEFLVLKGLNEILKYNEE